MIDPSISRPIIPQRSPQNFVMAFESGRRRWSSWLRWDAGSVLLGHFSDHIHRVIRGARRAVLAVPVAGPVQTPQLFEDERVMYFARARFEPSRVVPDLNDLDQLFLQACP